MDSLTSPSQDESKENDVIADVVDGENADSKLPEETSLSEGNSSHIGMSADQEQKSPDTVQQQEDEEDSITDGDSSEMSINNRFTALSKEQHTKESIIDEEELNNIDQEGEDTQLVDEMARVSLDDAFIEDSDAAEQVGEREAEALESKEYTVVNQDPELAFHTLAARPTPDKQECSVQSCLFQFTEVETLTRNNSLLCVTCTKRQKNKHNTEGRQTQRPRSS